MGLPWRVSPIIPLSSPSGFIYQQDVALKCTSGHFNKIMLVHPGDSSPLFGFSLFCSIRQSRNGRLQIATWRPWG